MRTLGPITPAGDATVKAHDRTLPSQLEADLAAEQIAIAVFDIEIVADVAEDGQVLADRDLGGFGRALSAKPSS